jgi:hypothetical protein
VSTMNDFEWDQTAMALIGYALSEDADASTALLGPLEPGDLREVAERLADILAKTLLEEAEAAGIDRREIVVSWQSCILQHAAQHRP